MDEISSLTSEPLLRVALVAKALTEGLDPTEIIDIVVRQQMAEFQAHSAVLTMLVEPSSTLVPVATLGYASEIAASIGPLALDRDLPITAAARDKTAVWVSNRADGEARFPALVDVAPDSQAWAAMPLVANGAVLGVLGVSFRAPRAFVDSERLFMRALTDVAALALAAHPALHGPSDPAAPARDRTEIALLDDQGVIVGVNDAWTEFCLANAGDPSACGVGVSYLAVCDRAGGIDEERGHRRAAAIRRVLAGELASISSIRLGCHSPTEQRWFEVLVSARVDEDRRVGAMVVLAPAPEPEPATVLAAPAIDRTEALTAASDGEAVADSLGLIAESIADLLEVSGAGISLETGGARRDVVATLDTVPALVWLQQQTHSGPGIEACRTGLPVVVDDVMARRADWPRLVDAMIACGVGAVLSVPIGVESPPIGVVTLYHASARRWSERDVASLQAMADVVAVHIATARSLEQSRLAIAQLETTLENRTVIEQAKGIVANAYGIRVDRAFELLRRYARSRRAPLRAIASGVVDLGLLPPGDDRSRATDQAPSSDRAAAASGDLDAHRSALDAIGEVYRIGLVLAPLVDGDDGLAAYAAELVASIDELIVGIRVTVTGQGPTVDDILDRAYNFVARIAQRLEILASGPHTASTRDVRAVLLADAAGLARRAAERGRDLRPVERGRRRT